MIDETKSKTHEEQPLQQTSLSTDKIIITSKNTNINSFPKIINSEKKEDFYKATLEFKEIMMIYESAIKMIETKLEVLNKEYKITGQRNPIDSVRSRIKTPVSIINKLEKRNLPITFSSMTENLCDIAGVRVICPYISDIYTTKDILLKQPDITLLNEKDYIQNPKESGYRSLHIVVGVPVYLSNTEHNVKVEIQLRTIAMDFWASLEHELRYKTKSSVSESIKRELFRCAETIAMTDRQMEQIAMELQTIN
ncbi:MAG: GTP pyrophosphokinase family protein [Treponema sp.]|nr:GTP pyrophosphokinase family protein [Treponema sp.]